MSKPVRKVRSNGRTIVGYMSSSTNGRIIQHESNLEKDFIYMLKFDPNVVFERDVHDQPVRISYSEKEKKKSYVPDFLVKYSDGSQVLFEVKYRDYLEKNAKELKPKFTAARKYAKEQGMKFQVITDAEIRTLYLKSIIFLDHFRSDVADLSLTQRIVAAFESKDRCTGNDLLSEIATDDDDYNALIRPFWVLVFNQKIYTDLFSELTLNSEFWLAGNEPQKFLTYPYKAKPVK
ncbi:MAG: TnsA endonuclease N-terminal domain-containing protein [Cyclobacteriaceae bacterium]|nr:TnsA endonuclease N-terminal domain-containing protein [Cyclobacteriaceae bacterium]